MEAPICGKDFKTGPDAHEDDSCAGPSRRACSALNGWFSTNILGNRDGEVLDDPGSFKTKEESKLSVLEHILAARAVSRSVRQHLPQGSH